MKKSFCFFFIFIILLQTLAGCAQTRPAQVVSEEPVELDWYVNFSWYNTTWGGNAVSDAITHKTGVTVNFISPEGSETQTLDALIAGDKLPDIITLGWW